MTTTARQGKKARHARRRRTKPAGAQTRSWKTIHGPDGNSGRDLRPSGDVKRLPSSGGRRQSGRSQPEDGCLRRKARREVEHNVMTTSPQSRAALTDVALENSGTYLARDAESRIHAPHGSESPSTAQSPRPHALTSRDHSGNRVHVIPCAVPHRSSSDRQNSVAASGQLAQRPPELCPLRHASPYAND